MEKLIIVFYINVDGMSAQVAKEGLYNLTQLYKTPDHIQYFMPVRNQPTKVECINPKIVPDSEYVEIKAKLDKIQKELEDGKIIL